MEELKYRVFDTNLQIDTFIGLDETETAVQESLVSLDKNEKPFCYGCSDDITNTEQFLIDISLKYKNGLKNKRILFIRSINNFEKEYEDELEIEKAINLFENIKGIFSESKCYFLLALSKPSKPMFPQNMFYAHIKINNDGKPKEFERVLMSRLGYLLRNQDNTGLKQKTKPYYAEQKFVDSEEDIEIEYNEVEYKIYKKDVEFNIFCNFKLNSDILVVFGQSALDQSVVTLPVFRRWSWAREVPYSCIVLNDPSLYKHKYLEAGWFVGDSTFHYAQGMAEIILSISLKLKIPTNKIVFIGASAGGFSSMAISSYIKGSSCIVDVPQTNLLKYSFKQQINKVAQYCFNYNDISLVPAEFQTRFVLSKLFEKNGYIPNIYYLQNTNDLTAGHLLTQCNSFMQEINALLYKNPSLRSTRIIYELYNRNHLLRGGHFPLGKYTTIHFLHEAIKKFCLEE